MNKPLNCTLATTFFSLFFRAPAPVSTSNVSLPLATVTNQQSTTLSLSPLSFIVVCIFQGVA